MATVELAYPPSANHQFYFVRGRPVLSKRARLYRHRVRQQVHASAMPVALGPLAIRLDLFPPDRRRRDCDNAQKPILDALQHSGAFADDSQIVWLLTVKANVVPNGKVIADIREIEDESGLPSIALIPSIPNAEL